MKISFPVGISSWNTSDVCNWLNHPDQRRVFGDSSSRFPENQIDGKVLLGLDLEALKNDLNITSLGHRVKIMEAISRLKSTFNLSSPHLTSPHPPHFTSPHLTHLTHLTSPHFLPSLPPPHFFFFCFISDVSMWNEGDVQSWLTSSQNSSFFEGAAKFARVDEDGRPVDGSIINGTSVDGRFVDGNLVDGRKLVDGRTLVGLDLVLLPNGSYEVLDDVLLRIDSDIYRGQEKSNSMFKPFIYTI